MYKLHRCTRCSSCPTNVDVNEVGGKKKNDVQLPVLHIWYSSESTLHIANASAIHSKVGSSYTGREREEHAYSDDMAIVFH